MPIVDPVLALTAFAGAALLLALLFWPAAGLVPRAIHLWRMTARVRHEDVLKQLYKLEYERLPATADSVAGGTALSRHQTLGILQRLEELDFVEPEGNVYHLTPQGQAYALRIVRTHRLWERYLADRTGTRPEEWHVLAERREHTLSPGDAEDLASALGHPLYDPHGDPIPTAGGQMPSRSGFPLPSLRLGEKAVITHLEDEPAAVYSELVALGLGPLVTLERIDAPKGRVRFRTGGVEHEVEAVVARNVTVEPTSQGEPQLEHATLAGLAIGESAEVVAIAPTCQGPARRRLLDLGLVPGTQVSARLRSAAGDPVAYEIRGALIALRRGQAEAVQVKAAGVDPETVSPGSHQAAGTPSAAGAAGSSRGRSAAEGGG
ncbi:MAG: hypothetical protein HKN73_08925 [Gemmatimonadetes bacterium]|nr:hypothetical protein [Gemmatimonadota bacterium]